MSSGKGLKTVMLDFNNDERKKKFVRLRILRRTLLKSNGPTTRSNFYEEFWCKPHSNRSSINGGNSHLVSNRS